MRLRGGYNILLEGRPSTHVEVLPEPEVLYLPLQSPRFNFSRMGVAEGQCVGPGDMLAEDPDNFNVPLLSPRAGTVRLGREGHVTIEDVQKVPEEPVEPATGDAARAALVRRGAWQFLQDAYTGALPDPSGMPQAIIVSTLRLEPYSALGVAHLAEHLADFIRGLEHLQHLLEYQPIYLVLPDVGSSLAGQVQQAVRGHVWVHPVQVPLRYPFDNFTVLARWLRLIRDAEQPVWALSTAGVLAVDRVLTSGRAATERTVSLAGPSVKEPKHLKVMPGYPLASIFEGRLDGTRCRRLSGGVMTGRALGDEALGLDVECEGFTVLPEPKAREFLAFVRPGSDRRSYSRCFLSALRGAAFERLTTSVRGERRPCISCGFCEEVCPAGIMPHLIHKYLYQDALEDIERARVDLCVGCGLCSFVCPSKIDVWDEIKRAREAIRRELHAGEVPA